VRIVPCSTVTLNTDQCYRLLRRFLRAQCRPGAEHRRIVTRICKQHCHNGVRCSGCQQGSKRSAFRRQKLWLYRVRLLSRLFASCAGRANSEIGCSFRGSTVPTQPAGVFWAVVNRLFIIFQLVFLLLSEVSWPMAFFDRFFPVLGSQFGLGSLGIFQGLYVSFFFPSYLVHRS
jgi:hypothetical protein